MAQSMIINDNIAMESRCVCRLKIRELLKILFKNKETHTDTFHHSIILCKLNISKGKLVL